MKKIVQLKMVESLGESFDSIFYLKKASTRVAVNGNTYMHLVLSDCTGEIIGRIWQDAPEILTLVEKVVQLSGIIEAFEGVNEVKVTSVVPALPKAYKMSDIVETDSDIEEMWSEIQTIIEENITSPHFSYVINKFYKNDAAIRKLKSMQGGTHYHHNIVGGLIRHIYTLLKLVLVSSELYVMRPEFSKELALTAVLLHDIGKLKEYLPFPKNQRTTLGQVVGHLLISYSAVESAIQDYSQMATEKAATQDEPIPPFPEEDMIKLLNCIATSHGPLDHGCIKASCIEAIMISKLDDFDSEIDGAMRVICADTTPGDLTAWDKFHKQSYLKF